LIRVPSAGPLATPRICCLDLDTFFVSVERVLDPTLEGKPVVVGGRPGSRGVVLAASYEVRAYGIKAGMSTTEAGQRAPKGTVWLAGRGHTYSAYSERVRELAAKFSPEIQIASIDEMFIDFRGCERMYASPDDADDDETIYRVVAALTQAIHDEIGLPSSAGIATSKVVSKIASCLAKPRGVLLVPAGAEPDFLGPLPVRSFPGIGPVGEAKLLAAGITTLADVARTPGRTLQKIFGAWGPHIQRGVQGRGSGELGRERPAFREHDPAGTTVGSISNERTFREDVRDPGHIEAMLSSLCERVCWRARKRGVKARTVTLKLRYADFSTLSRSHTMAPSNSEVELFPVVRDLYRKARTRAMPIRLLGLALSNLGLFEQLSLFGPDDKLHGVVDEIRTRYGFDTMRWATSRRATRGVRAPAEHPTHRKRR
jgi:DNA polymerase-4